LVTDLVLAIQGDRRIVRGELLSQNRGLSADFLGGLFDGWVVLEAVADRFVERQHRAALPVAPEHYFLGRGGRRGRGGGAEEIGPAAEGQQG
jgi:hypothetical protein